MTLHSNSSHWKVQDYFGSRSDEFCHTYLHRLSGDLCAHTNDFYELNIVIEGTARHTIEKTDYDAECGSVYFIPPGITHGFSSTQCVIFHALIREDFFEIYSMELQNIKGYTLLFEIDPYLRTATKTSLPLRLSYDEYEMVSPVMQHMLKNESMHLPDIEHIKNLGLLYLFCLLSSIISEKQRKQISNSTNKPYDVHIARSMEFIRMNVSRQFSIEDLAKHALMSRSTYMRNFSMMAGCSPMQFLTRCRMAHARKLLFYTDIKITEVASACGFCDASHFTHVFTKYEGVTPSDYRTMNYAKAHYSVCSICQAKP